MNFLTLYAGAFSVNNTEIKVSEKDAETVFARFLYLTIRQLSALAKVKTKSWKKYAWKPFLNFYFLRFEKAFI